MKTLQEYIFEKMSQEEFLKKIHYIYNDDYEYAFNVLKNYDPNQQKVESKLEKLFENKGLSALDNKSIIKNIRDNFDSDIINTFIELCENQNINMFNTNEEPEILRNDNLLNIKNEKLTKLIKYLINIKDFAKPNNTANIGKFELLFILLYGTPIKSKDGNLTGDLHLSNGVTIEIKSINSQNIKSKTPLSSNIGEGELKSIKTLSEKFLRSIFTNEEDQDKIVEIFKSERKHFKEIKDFLKSENQTNKTHARSRKSIPERCLANESAYINIMTILNTFFYGKEIPEDLCETLFRRYIEILLLQFGQADEKDNVFKELNKNYNPFYVKDNFIYCKKLTQITGAIHLYGYAKRDNFNHILIGDEASLKCICIKNVNTVEVIETVLKHIIFIAADAKDSTGRHNNVSKIKNFK